MSLERRWRTGISHRVLGLGNQLVDVVKSSERKHADDFGHHLQREKHGDYQERSPERRQRDVQASLDEIERREDSKGDGAHATNKRFVAKEYARNNETKEIGWQDSFAFSRRGEAAKQEKHKENKFYFRFAHLCCAQSGDDRLRPARHEP